MKYPRHMLAICSVNRLVQTHAETTQISLKSGRSSSYSTWRKILHKSAHTPPFLLRFYRHPKSYRHLINHRYESGDGVYGLYLIIFGFAFGCNHLLLVNLDVYCVFFTSDFILLLRKAININALMTCRERVFFKIVGLAKHQLFYIVRAVFRIIV